MAWRKEWRSPDICQAEAGLKFNSRRTVFLWILWACRTHMRSPAWLMRWICRAFKSDTRRDELIWRAARLFARSVCRRALCRIQPSKCVCQQSLLVTRTLGRDWFLTSLHPKTHPTRREAEICGDAHPCLCLKGWRPGSDGQISLSGCRQLRQPRGLLECCAYQTESKECHIHVPPPKHHK